MFESSVHRSPKSTRGNTGIFEVRKIFSDAIFALQVITIQTVTSESSPTISFKSWDILHGKRSVIISTPQKSYSIGPDAGFSSQWYFEPELEWHRAARSNSNEMVLYTHEINNWVYLRGDWLETLELRDSGKFSSSLSARLFGTVLSHGKEHSHHLVRKHV